MRRRETKSIFASTRRCVISGWRVWVFINESRPKFFSLILRRLISLSLSLALWRSGSFMKNVFTSWKRQDKQMIWRTNEWIFIENIICTRQNCDCVLYIPTCYSLFIYFISYRARLKQGALAHVLFIVSGGEREIETERIRLSKLWEETNEVIEALFFCSCSCSHYYYCCHYYQHFDTVMCLAWPPHPLHIRILEIEYTQRKK